ncbi:hypothetical protein [Neobacillus sp. LXY-4]|uniref:hypothetical protein n=1 Tax=Neobacillus sp. LXY-4 TaxID=3379826 RepID=UPI003EDF2D4B
MKQRFGEISLVLCLFIITFFIANFYIRLDVTLFRIIMIIGTLSSLILFILSPLGKWKTVSLAISIILTFFYFLGVELLRVLFQGNGF